MRLQSENTVFKFLRRSVDGETLDAFSEWTSVFKFLRRSVDGETFDAFTEWNLRFQISPA